MAEMGAILKSIRDKIIAASAKRPPEYQYYEPHLIAVSKLKPVESITTAYEAGQRHFGENYVNELVTKSTHPDILENCKQIQWHFIGHLQRNKVNKVLTVPNLYMIQTIDNEKIALAIDSSWPKFRRDQNSKLKIMVQVNTSQEKEKSGCLLGNVTALVEYILKNCKNLEFMGLMTIGMYGYDVVNGPNPDFLCLRECKDKICKDLELDSKMVELSMGMSTDYEHAIELGSAYVRVGTGIFGERSQKINET